MNLPSDFQRLLPYIAVAVLAIVGLILVVRGVAPSDGGGATEPARIDRGGEVRGDGNRGEGSGRDGTNRDGGSAGGGERVPAKRTAKAYVACVQQAADPAALEKCQTLLP
jgi:hypothetical protein